MVALASVAAAAGMSGAMAQERSIVVTAVSSFKLIETLVPDFVKETGNQVDLQVLPYPQVRQRSIADFVSGTTNSDIYEQDIIWLGEWAKNGYPKAIWWVNAAACGAANDLALRRPFGLHPP